MQIRHDIHTHTLISYCAHDQQATAANFLAKAANLGHTVFGISNHLWDFKVGGFSQWYRDQSQNYVMEERAAIDAAEHYGMKVLFGAETEYRGMNDILGITADTAAKFDYILIPHSHTHMRGFVIPETPQILNFRKSFGESLKKNYPWMSDTTITRIANSIKIEDTDVPFSKDAYDAFVSDFLISSYETLFENSEFKKVCAVVPVIIAHPFSACEGDETVNRLDRERLRRAFLKTAEMNVGFDLNIAAFKHPENNYADDPMVHLMKLAKECGIKFAFGTDAHSVASLENIRKGDIIADAIGITEDDFVDFIK